MARWKFSLRDLFWLVLVAAMGIGWWVERSQLKQRLERDTRHINVWSLPDESLEAFVDECAEYRDPGLRGVQRRWRNPPLTRPT
jgi:hypothetical protein